MDAELNPAQRLHALGQSLWLDSINRVMLRTGTLARYVRDLAVTGLTSNPTILGHAMAAGSDYDSSLGRLAGEGVTDAQDLVYALALEDLAEAAALFRPEWERTEGVDGYVSLEVPPDAAYDAAATVALARRSWPSACLMARVRQLWAFWRVLVACVAAIFASALRTS
jgi:transaldolase